MILWFAWPRNYILRATLRATFSRATLRANQQIRVRYDPQSPEGRKAGKWLAGGYKGVLFSIGGDLDYFAKWLNLSRWSKESSPCSLCQCVAKGVLSWHDNRYPAAPWLKTIWTSDSWNKWPGRSKSPLFTLEWISAANVFYDWMHTKHLGADQYIFGSVLWLLVFQVLPASPIENLGIVWRYIKKYYQVHKFTGTRYRSITKLSMFVRKKGFAKLRGKASEIKHFSGVILDVWAHFMKATDEHKAIKLLLKKTHQLNCILDNHKVQDGYIALPERIGNTFIDACFTMAQLQKQLGESFKAQGIKIFTMTAKTHCMMHTALLCKAIHPALVWCYQGESFMRVVQRIMQSCVRGNNPFNAMSKATEHYNLGMQLRYEEESKNQAA